MTFDKGRVGVLIVILSLIASVGLGVITNIETKTVQKDVTSYVADITGAFDSEKQQAYTDYNPAKNYSGYTGTNTTQFPIDFVSSTPNNYPIVYYTNSITGTYEPNTLMNDLGLTPEIGGENSGLNYYFDITVDEDSTLNTFIEGPMVASVSHILLSDVVNGIVGSDPNGVDITQIKITIPIRNLYKFTIMDRAPIWGGGYVDAYVESAICPDNYTYIWPTNNDNGGYHLKQFLKGTYGEATNYPREISLIYSPSTNIGTLYLNGTQWNAGDLSSYTLYWGRGYPTGESSPFIPCPKYHVNFHGSSPLSDRYAPPNDNTVIIEKVYNRHTEYIDTRYGVSPRGNYYTNMGDPAEDIIPALTDYSDWDLSIGYDTNGTVMQATSNDQIIFTHTASPTSSLNVMGYGDTYGFYTIPSENGMDLITPTSMASEPANTLLIKKENGQYSLSKVYNDVTTLIASNIGIDNLFISKDDGSRVFQKSNNGEFAIGYDEISDMYGIGFKEEEPSNITTWNDGDYHAIVGSGDSLAVVTNDWSIVTREYVGYNVLSSMKAIIGNTTLSTAEYICAPKTVGQKETVIWSNDYENGVTDIAFSVWNGNAEDKFSATNNPYTTIGTLNYKGADPDVLTVTRVGANMYVSLNNGEPVNIGAWNQIQVTLDNVAGVIYVYPIQTWANFNNYTVSPVPIEINGLKKANLTSISWQANNSLRLEVVNTQVFFNSYGVVMVDPEIEINRLWPNYQKYMVKISDVASIGKSIEIGQQSYDITDNTITIPQTRNSVTLDVTDMELYYTQIENGWRVYAQSGKASAEIDVEDTTLKFNGLWYFKAGFYSIETKNTTERTWNPITYNWFESNLFFWMAGMVLVFSIIAYKTGYLDGLSIVILIGTEVILILIGGT